MSLLLPLLKYQEQGSQFVQKYKYVLIGDEMGLGKSVQAIDVINEVYGKSLIVCPAYLRFNWVNEFKKFTGDKFKILTITKGSDIKKFNGDFDVVITSYSLLECIEGIADQFDIIVADECQYLKNIITKRYKSFHRVLSKSKADFFIPLSGTPITKCAADWFGILSLLSLCPQKCNGLDVNFFFKRYSVFAKHFSHVDVTRVKMKWGVKEILKYYGVKRKEELKRLLVGKYIRRKAEDHLDLPPIEDRDISMADATSPELERMYEGFKRNEEGHYLTSLKAQFAFEKVNLTLRYCQDLLEAKEGPLLVYSDHTGPVSTLVGNFKRKGFRASMIQGSTPDKDREDRVNRFQEGKLDVLVCTYGSASTGLNLTACRNVVCNDLTWNVAIYQQMRKRIHRIGQEHRCVIHRILSSEIDKMIVKALTEKAKTLEEAT